MFFRTPIFIPWLFPALVWRMSTEQKQLFLTFDDGPVPGPTEFVLETLRQYNVHATFFCIGNNIEKHPEIFLEIVNQGHTIGNHTFNHINGWSTRTEKYLSNIKKCDEIINGCLPTFASEKLSPPGQPDTDGVDPDKQLSLSKPLFRPPYGRISFGQIARLRESYNIIMWDVLSYDFDKQLGCDKCLRNTIGAIRPGSIVVFHDSYKAEKNLTYALPKLIGHFLEKGFQFKAL